MSVYSLKHSQIVDMNIYLLMFSGYSGELKELQIGADGKTVTNYNGDMVVYKIIGRNKLY